MIEIKANQITLMFHPEKADDRKARGYAEKEGGKSIGVENIPGANIEEKRTIG